MRREIASFAVAGVLGFVVDTGGLYAALALGAGYFVGRFCSFTLAVWVTWQFNRRYTFRNGRGESALKEWLRYLLAMSAGGVTNLIAYSASVMMLPKTQWLPFIAVAIGAALGMVLNFVSAKWWVFRSSV